jgi:carbonic anhydrase/acetyltransferase-like protein (isoleucine patch superfamily)
MIKAFRDHLPVVPESAFVAQTALVMGEVTLGERCGVWPGAVIRGDIHRIRIGRETNIQDGSVLHISHDGPFMPGGSPLTVGDRVTVGHKAVLHGCEIHDDCLIGMGAIVMDKAVIESGVMVGAGSLVPPGKTLTSGYLYTGSPARQARPLSEREKEYFSYSAAYYSKLARRHRRALG